MIEIERMSEQELLAIIAKAKDLLYSEAVIVDGELVCSHCQKTGEPNLIEGGYEVTHNLLEIKDGEIRAEGWNGSSKDVSESGDGELLECQSCHHNYRIPDSINVTWV